MKCEMKQPVNQAYKPGPSNQTPHKNLLVDFQINVDYLARKIHLLCKEKPLQTNVKHLKCIKNPAGQRGTRR